MTTEKTAPISISIQGADSAHYCRISAPESHLIRFPDGITRLITLPRWHWEAMRQMHENDVVYFDEFISAGYQLACEFYKPCLETFEDKIRHSFALFIRVCWNDEVEKAHCMANQNSSTAMIEGNE